MHNTWPLTSTATWCPCGPDALVNTSVFCTDLRLQYGWKIITATLVSGIVKKRGRHETTRNVF